MNRINTYALPIVTPIMTSIMTLMAFLAPAETMAQLSCRTLFQKPLRTEKANVDIINSLLKQISAEPENGEVRMRLQRAMALDDSNFSAFMVLYAAYAHPKSDAIRIHEPGKDDSGQTIAYPTAIAPKDLLAKLPFVEYERLSDAQYTSAAKNTVLWTKKMQAGTGSKLSRFSYLSRILGIPEKAVRIGAKGTDLYVDLKSGGPRPLAELQLLQLIIEARQGHFNDVVFHDLVSTETQASLDAIWKKPSLIDPKKTYAELVGAEGVRRFLQAQVPTLTEAGDVSYNRTAPSGHWIFAVDALRAAIHDTMRPKTAGKPLVSVIGNGEDLSSTPDAKMVGWMVAEKIPIVMVTTEKTANDMKGGQISLAKNPQGETYVTIIEHAQAKESGQADLFEKIGLQVKNAGQISFFNTNMALFNYEVLVPKLKALVNEIGEKAFLEILAPDLIMNWKDQVDKDGVTRKYLQIEGAMGSTLLNLDRFWRAKYGEPLVHFINVSQKNRTRFFSPIKTAFDYFMQFKSDRFRLNEKTMRLENLNPSGLPSVNLKDKFYDDLQNVLDSFQGASIVGLHSLSIDGKVSLRGAVLEGDVEIINRAGRLIDMSNPNSSQPLVLKDAKIEIDQQGRMTISKIGEK